MYICKQKYKMSIQKEIPELIKAGIISEDVANNIKEYYKNKEGKSSNRLFVVFGVLGAILVGLGIILIIAHNWDELSRTSKTILSFIPLVVGQLLVGYTLLKKQNSIAWRESSTAFLFFAVGASISLISQVYNISGNLSSFLLTWMLLIIPLVYVMRSSIASLLYIAGISYYVVEAGYSFHHSVNFNYYWILLFLILPFYYLLYKHKPKSNSMTFHNWLLPLSLLLALGTLSNKNEEFMFVAYISLLGVFYLLGNTKFFAKQKLINNSFKIIGSLGTIGILLTLSFDWFWQDLRNNDFIFEKIIQSSEFIVSLILIILAGVLLFYQIKGKSIKEIKPISLIFLLFVVIYFVGTQYFIAPIIINIIIFVVGILTMREGAEQNHLGILNYGLLIITALIFCRFFDVDLSFILRGMLFIFVGVGFFVANYMMLKRRKNDKK